MISLETTRCILYLYVECYSDEDNKRQRTKVSASFVVSRKALSESTPIFRTADPLSTSSYHTSSRQRKIIVCFQRVAREPKGENIKTVHGKPPRSPDRICVFPKGMIADVGNDPCSNTYSVLREEDCIRWISTGYISRYKIGRCSEAFRVG